MKMSKGQIGRRLLGLAVVGAALVTAGGTAFAELGQPAPWEFKLQGSATQVMDDITSFHNCLLLTIITFITLFVLGLLLGRVVRFNAKRQPGPRRWSHNTTIEIAWTAGPGADPGGHRGLLVPAAVSPTTTCRSPT